MKLLIITIKDFWLIIKSRQEIFFEKIIRLIIYSGAFLLPLFCLPLSSGFGEYSKAMIFYALVSLAVIFWLIKIFTSQKIDLSPRTLDIPIILFLFIYLLSSIFSVERYQSFWGHNLFVSFSLSTFLFLVLYYFLLSRFINSVKEIKNLFYCLNVSILLLLIINIFKIILPNFSGSFCNISFNTFNFLLILGVCLSGLLFLLAESKKGKILNIIFGLVLLSSAYFADISYILLTFILMVFFFMCLSSLKAENFSNKLIIGLTILLFISIIMLILPLGNFTKIIIPSEINLPNSLAWQITRASLNENLLLGVGPQNFAYSFYKFKPQEFNLSNFWQIGFAKSSNFYWELLNNIGLLGFITFFIIVGKYLVVVFRSTNNLQIIDSYSYRLFIINIGLAAIIFSLLFYFLFFNADFVMLFILFTFLALGATFSQYQQKEIIWSNNLLKILFNLVLICIIIFLYFWGRLVMASIHSEMIINKNYSSINDYNWSEGKLKSAISLNPFESIYRLQLSQLLINKIVFLRSNQEQFEEISMKEQIDANFEQAWGKGAVYLANYLLLHQIDNELNNLGYQENDALVRVNQKIIELDPFNPEHYIDRALLNFNNYLLIKKGELAGENPQNQMDVLLKKVQSDLEKSLQLKNNFVLGYFNLGLYYQEIGDQAKALDNIAKAFDLDPSQKLVASALKKLYLNQDKVSEAIDILNKCLQYNPNDSELRLELAVVYNDNKQPDKAKEELNKILQLDPTNASAQQLLDQIK